MIELRKTETFAQWIDTSRETFGVAAMTKTTTTRYDVADHLRTPEEIAAYFDACLEEADGDAAFIAKALGDLRSWTGDMARWLISELLGISVMKTQLSN